MKISLIAAIADNNVIGKDNNLLWRLPADVKFFREVTTGHHILTGRKNYESIPEKFRPLSDRTNIVISRNEGYKAPGAHVFTTIEEGIEFARSQGEDELFIIGGANIYDQVMDRAHILYITEVHGSFEGDVWFPHIDPLKWQLVIREERKADEKNPYDMSFCTYMKKGWQE